MNRLAHLGTLIAAGLAFGMLEGCRRQPTAQPDATAIRLENPDARLQETIIAAKDDLFGRLSGRLMQVLQEQGPAAAISVCSQEAPAMAQEVGRERGLRIARTSLKLRNPANTPPKWAEPIIQQAPDDPQYFDLGQGHTGALLPIRLQATCLLCHGQPDVILDEVKQQLARFYPRDQATGYNEGDLRGWFWVELPPEAASALP